MYIKANDIQNKVSNSVTNMNVGEYDKDQVISLIKDATDIAIVPSKVAGTDSYCASAGLYHMLKEKFGEGESKKQIKFLFAGQTPQGYENIINKEDIITNISDRELMLSVDFSGTNASKVQYTTEDETLFLKLGPIPKHFDKNRIKAKITGFDFDLVFVIGAQELGDLGPIYNNLRGEINRANKINIDISPKNHRFGIVNIIDDHVETLSTLVFKKASGWDLVPNKSAAKALLAGMTYRDGRHG